MKKKLYMDDFESFLSESAEEVRMYPSDKVWRNIDHELRGENHWPALTFGAILTGALILAGLIFLHPDKDLFDTKKLTTSYATAAMPPIGNAKTEFAILKEKEKPAGPLVTRRAGDNNQIAIAEANFQNDISVDEGAALHSATEIVAIANSTPEAMLPTNETLYTANSNLQETTLGDADGFETKDLVPQASPITTYAVANEQQVFTPEAAELKQQQAAGGNSAAKATQGKKNNRWSLQYYVTPSMSYRLLQEEKNFDKQNFVNGNIPASYYNSVNTMVSHKPGMGLEAGMSFNYQVTDRLSVKGGLQLNYRNYAIDAFETGVQQASVIRLAQGNTFDTLYSMSNVSNFTGRNSIEIRNRFLQVGIPIGFELTMADFNKAKFVVAATMQPTYNIGQQSWLISSDYQTYVKQPDLLRKWNVNTGVEAFIRFGGKNGLNWQVGPQIRYQLLSGAVKQYPVREHLIDYGIKIGVSKTL